MEAPTAMSPDTSHPTKTVSKVPIILQVMALAI